MKTLALIAAFSFSYSNSDHKPETGSGRIKEETRDIKNFKGISLAHNLQAKVSPGSFKVHIKADDNILTFIETEVSHGVLQVKYKDGVAFTSNNPVEIFIQAPVIDSIDLSGASSLTGDVATRDALEIDTSGSSAVQLGRINVKNLDIDSSGASKVTLEQVDGRTLNIGSSGSSNIKLEKLNASTLTVDASGASSLQLGGTSEKVELEVSGGTRVKANQLNARTVAIDASGASESELKNAAAIEGNLTGGSRVHAAKSARVDIKSSRAARIIQD